MILWWREEVDLRIMSYSVSHIDACINGSVKSRITLFYGSPYSHLRQTSWNLLRKLASMSVNPWIVLGDFNEVCFSWERNSLKIKGEWQMKRFRETLQDCQLFDIGFKGSPYSFSNHRM